MVLQGKFIRLSLYLVFLSISVQVFSQNTTERALSGIAFIDSLKSKGLISDMNRKKPEILLSKDQAIRFLQERSQEQYWVNRGDPFRMALNHLVYEASHQRFDSTEFFLQKYPYDSLSIPWDKFYVWEPLSLKIQVKSYTEVPILADSSENSGNKINDSLIIKTFANQNKLIEKQSPVGLKDTSILIVKDTLQEVTSPVSSFPFRYFNYPYQGDSIKEAVRSLMKYLDERDSTLIRFRGTGKMVVPMWMNSKSDVMMRYWLRNEFSDSVTVWIGNTSRDTIGLFLERGVSFRRPLKQYNYSEAKIDIRSPDNSKLLAVQKILIKPQYWKFREEAAFVVSQTAMSNWVRGGENSISFLTDMTGFADYYNKDLKVSSSNFARLKLGFMKTGSEPVRKNLDLLETNSKLNHKAFGKFDFSAIMLVKTQTSPGYNYTRVNNRDTAILVSKFMNPAILVIGIGLDYKPNKSTSINFSPLSYKGTFVTDTSNIDQTKYGIPKNRKSLIEPGASFMITNDFRPVKNLLITNRLQLFTNYIHNPQNVDVDWEMIATANLNWFTDVRFNTHLIFDDDTKTPELDKNKQPVLNSDGTVKKTARIQFKEMLGFSVVFRF
jgi:hypothetical protein